MSEKNLFIIQSIIYKAVQKAGFELNKEDIRIDQTRTIEHGHFATNIAMVLAGKSKSNPREIAQKIVDNLSDPLLENVKIAGPGFINLWIEQKFYTEECQSMINDLDDYIKQTVGIKDGKKMVIDYSSPNIAKPLGVHHLLSTIIGDSIKLIYRKMGYEVIADNYLGDMGTQFGKLIYAIKTWGDITVIEKDPINELLKLYVHFHDESEKNKDLDGFARIEFKKFEEGDRENRDFWQRIVKWSSLEIQPLYKRLGIKFDYYNGESFYEDKMQSLLEEGRQKGVFVDGENGAWIVESDDPNNPPAIVRKSDGSTIYLTRDLAQTAYWEKEFHPDLMIWVVDIAQSLHFKQRFNASKKLGQTDAKMVHVDFGRMQFKDGSMSTRKGNIIRLSEVLNEAEKRSFEIVKEKGIDLDEAKQKQLSAIMGIGAVKYNILSQNRTTNITFDWDKMLAFEGNSVPYLMYTVTRAKSIIRKSGSEMRDVSTFDFNELNAQELKTIIQLLMYIDALKRASEEFKPNHIANCLYNLAQEFNTFYNSNDILRAEDDIKKSRLLLTATVIKVMEDGLGLLGIEVPERM